MGKVEGPPGVTEPRFDFRLYSVQPSHCLGVGVASARESACGSQSFTGLSSARSVFRKRRREGHVRKRRSAEEIVPGFVRGLKREHEARLCQLGLLEVEESQTTR